MQTSTKLRAAALSLLPLALAACGKVDAAKHPSTTPLVIPSAGDDGSAPFALTDEGPGRAVYLASLLVWNPAATPDEIRAVSEASVDKRVKIAAYRKHLRDEHDPAKAAVDAKAAELAATRAAVGEARSNTEAVAAALREPLAGWFEKRLTELALTRRISNTTAELTHARTHFGAYCEYKIWELATSPLLASTFKTRPTPLQMCEGYYAQKGLLSRDAEACADAPAGQRKDYFTCVWQQGVLLTQIFAAQLADTACSSDRNLKRGAAVASWVELPAFKTAIFDTESAYGDETYADQMRYAIVDRNSVDGLEVTDKYPFVARCADAFAMDFRVPEAGDWRYAGPKDLKSIVEGTGTGSEPFLLLAKVQGDSDANKARHELLAAHVALFASRNEGYSVNDQIFNQNAGRSVRATEAAYARYSQSGEFEAVRAEEARAVPRDLRLRESALADQLAALEATLAVKAAEKDALESSAGEATEAGARAALAPGVALVVLPFNVDVRRVPGALEVRFNIDAKTEAGTEARGAVGCLPLADTDAPCTAARSAREQGWSELTGLGWDSASGELTFDVTLDAPEAQGFGLRPRSSDTKMQEIPEEGLQGLVLHLSVAPGRLDGVLDFVTGKAEIVAPNDHEQVLYQGSFSGEPDPRLR